MPTQDIAGGAGFVNHAQLDVFRGEFLEEFVHGLERTADDAVLPDFAHAFRRDGHGDRFFMDVQTEVRHCFLHGCLVSFMV